MADFEFIITETSSMVDLEEYLDYLIIERCNEIYYKLISRDAEYQNLQAQIESCFEELLRALPEPIPQYRFLGSYQAFLGFTKPYHTYKKGGPHHANQ